MPLSAPEDVCNQALRAIGYRREIGDIFEGSPASRACLQLYGQTRDELLRGQEWPFARGFATLTLLKGPPPPGGYNPALPWGPTYPPPGWLYEYVYPADCLELRALARPPGAMPALDPKPALRVVVNDPVPLVAGGVASGPPQRVILANLAAAVAVYRRRVTNPLLWEPGFCAAFIDRLAAKLAASPDLAASQDFAKMLPQQAVGVAAVADRHRG